MQPLWKARAEGADMEGQIAILDLLAQLPRTDPGSPVREAVLVEVAPDRQSASLSLLLPYKGGAFPTSQEIQGELRRAGVVHGIDAARVEACAALLASSGHVLRVAVARGTLPVPGAEPRPEFSVPVVSVERFREGKAWRGADLLAFQTVEASASLGTLHPGSAGTPGRDVLGRATPTPPRPPPPLASRIGVDPQGSMSATADGLVVRSSGRWDVVPLFLVRGDYHSEAGPIRFPGIVAIEGNCRGAEVEAEEFLVGGDLWGGRVAVRGDVHVAGTITGGGKTCLVADGFVTARAIESAPVDALGGVLVRQSIANAQIATLGRVVVTEAGGEISGGSVAAFRGVEAPSLGSDFGIPTAVSTGRDFLTAKRLTGIEEGIVLHAENLQKIAALKKRLAQAGLDPAHLPPEKQDVYVSVMKKEAASRQQLASLERQRERFQQTYADFMEATIRVSESLHPPVNVQIGGILRQIQERLRDVVLGCKGEAIETIPAHPSA